MRGESNDAVPSGGRRQYFCGPLILGPQFTSLVIWRGQEGCLQENVALQLRKCHQLVFSLQTNENRFFLDCMLPRYPIARLSAFWIIWNLDVSRFVHLASRDNRVTFIFHCI